ncbi:MAG: 16S rRNA (guanine(966)-N(2))-methyltransferase RsmD [Rhodobacteraceae bacterium]|jgi:16S rRNA (guanine966-N2)-methyltransferase|nr:16S rRNA (guanine(966)-N(2))-methyltransferase RsmD [Paracoccaceae bacterium]MBL4558788.1 16S rRNA (guanine(966)-N(2))-methyltransferase RsmD [Paracoccaceae bacterium]HBG98701.1 16S rRNA (guanine(966)-N(2))-methyltransferase RsmD [Paracoccaceae bacterium]
MRIVGGRLRGRALAALGAGDRSAHLRPTLDRVRENLFNLLAHGAAGDPVPGARVLDAFAGTGALGFEALSRGARQATFLDTGRKALALLRRNAGLLDLGDAVTILQRDATRPGRCPGAPCDLIFLDPPYGTGLGATALSALAGDGWIAPGAILVWEDAAPPIPPPGFDAIDQRRYGTSTLTLLRAAGARGQDAPT